MINFRSRVSYCNSHSPALLNLFIYSNTLFSGKLFSSFGNSDHGVVLVSMDFLPNSKGDNPFHFIAYEYFRGDWDDLCDHLRDVLWEDFLKLGTYSAGNKFYEWVQVGIDLYLSS